MKTKGKVFLLDDDELIVSMLERALKGDGYEVRAESDPEGVLDKMMPLAAKYDADIIALAMTLAGIPRDRDERMVNAATIIGKAMEHGVALDRIYLDPLVLPIGVAQADVMECIEAVRLFQDLNDGAPMKSVVGLSNVYNGTPKHLHARIGSTFFTLLASAGLTAAASKPRFNRL